MSKIPIRIVSSLEDLKLKQMHDDYQTRQAVLMTIATTELIAELLRRGCSSLQQYKDENTPIKE
jgi:hypothetical protein